MNWQRGCWGQGHPLTSPQASVKGYLSSRKERDGRTFRRVYTATPLGRQALEVGREKLRELFREVAAGEARERSD